MPLIDLPLDQLRLYQGRNPRPDDFDAFWARGLAELEATPSDVTLTPSTDFRTAQADCQDLWFTGTGGARVYAKLLRPKARAARGPALLLFHGYTGGSGDWSDKLGHVLRGFTVAALDCRGQGGESQQFSGAAVHNPRGHIIQGLDLCDPPEALGYRQVFLDTVCLARIVMDLDGVDQARVATMGGSQGGALAFACAALEPRICLAIGAYPFLCDYQRVWELDRANDIQRAYGELAYFFRSVDPRHLREAEYFTRLGYIDLQHLAPRIAARVLMATGLMDITCPPSSQFAFYNKVNSAKDLLVYPDFGHESLPGFGDQAWAALEGLL